VMFLFFAKKNVPDEEEEAETHLPHPGGATGATA
jgi:hypothetical protein